MGGYQVPFVVRLMLSELFGVPVDPDSLRGATRLTRVDVRHVPRPTVRGTYRAVVREVGIDIARPTRVGGVRLVSRLTGIPRRRLSQLLASTPVALADYNVRALYCAMLAEGPRGQEWHSILTSLLTPPEVPPPWEREAERYWRRPARGILKLKREAEGAVEAFARGTGDSTKIRRNVKQWLPYSRLAYDVAGAQPLETDHRESDAEIRLRLDQREAKGQAIIRVPAVVCASDPDFESEFGLWPAWLNSWRVTKGARGFVAGDGLMRPPGRHRWPGLVERWVDAELQGQT